MRCPATYQKDGSPSRKLSSAPKISPFGCSLHHFRNTCMQVVLRLEFCKLFLHNNYIQTKLWHIYCNVNTTF